MRNRILTTIISILLIFSICLFGGCKLENGGSEKVTLPEENTMAPLTEETITLQNIPEFSGRPYVAIYDNLPLFSKDDYTTEVFETYAELDSLGRCGVTFACIGKELMPTEDRGNIGQVKPSGWVTAKYDFVDGKYLYNRCHLIGFQLTGENANTSNLITGTRYMNVQGMLPFENMVADYVKETENHVLYRVTPVFEGDNLVASGVVMEAWSVEDEGEGICFNVYCYNVQPGVKIDYATGESTLDESYSEEKDNDVNSSQFVLNTSSKKVHKPTCSGATGMSEKNKKTIKGTELQQYLDQGYEYCGTCFNK